MKFTKRQLKQIIKEELTDYWDNRDKIAMSGMAMAEPPQDPNIEKIKNIVYSLPNVTEDNFELNIEKNASGEYEVFHSEYAMDKLASLADLDRSHEIYSMFKNAGFEVGERWNAKEPVVLIDPKMSR